MWALGVSTMILLKMWLEGFYGILLNDLMQYICETMEIISHGSYV